jgi:ArsR family transcriptional regulator, arsenate/arsenite/antimonite-responsive transcriptional repressor
MIRLRSSRQSAKHDERRKLRNAAQLLRTLAHPTRLAIVRELAAGPKCVTDIRELLEVAQPNVSQHLSALRNAGVVDYHEQGKQRCYYLSRAKLVKRLLAVLDGDDLSVFLTPEQVLRAAAKRKSECGPSTCR